MKYRLSQINIFPVKSLGGVTLQQAYARERGLLYDRRWMIADSNNRFMTQREHPRMATVGIHLQEDGFLLYKKADHQDSITLPFSVSNTKEEEVIIWKDKCNGLHFTKQADEWISDHLKVKCSFIYMPESSKRLVDTAYAKYQETVGFADAFPFMILGEESVKELNGRLIDPVPMNRFRPNLVFAGGQCFDEDRFGEITIGTAVFSAAKLCGRCSIVTVDQDNGVKGIEPLKTLAGFRTVNNNTYFGQYLLLKNPGIVQVGDAVSVNAIQHN